MKLGRGLLVGGLLLGGVVLLSQKKNDEPVPAFGSGGGSFPLLSSDPSGVQPFVFVESPSFDTTPSFTTETATTTAPATTTKKSSGSSGSTALSIWTSRNAQYGGTLDKPIPFTTAMSLDPVTKPTFQKDYSDNPTAPTIANATKKAGSSTKYGGLYNSPSSTSTSTSSSRWGGFYSKKKETVSE